MPSQMGDRKAFRIGMNSSNLRLICVCFNVGKNAEVHFIWIPVHCKVLGNEETKIKTDATLQTLTA